MIRFLESQNIYYLFSLLILVLPVVLFILRRGAQNSFWVKSTRVRKLKRRNLEYLIVKLLLITIMVVFSVLALMGPAGEPERQVVESRGRDLLVLLDVSRSMDAQDMYPSRLERAKWELMETAGQMGGDRVALMVFAGTTVLKCPFTQDHGFFKMALEEVSSQSISRGGSNLGDALRQAALLFDGNDPGTTRNILLITDGEDHGSFPVEAAKALADQGVRLLVVGLGSSAGNALVDYNGDPILYQGEQVYSRLDSQTLREMAGATPGGKYVEAGIGGFHLAGLYQEFLADSSLGETVQDEFLQYKQYFLWFLIPVILAFILFLYVQWRYYRGSSK